MLLPLRRILLAEPTDKPDSGTLPDPNLNPLSNPVLGQHMGRWAEVYFTSPPEKREEAVQELLRELAGDSKVERAAIENSQEQLENTDRAIELQSLLGAPHLPVVCPRCGEESTPSQKYCGSCGAVLLEGTSSPSSVAPASALQTAHRSLEEVPFAPYASSILGISDDDESFRSAAEDAPRFIPEYEPVHYRYRLYIGAALAVVIGLLVFAAWRNNAVSSDGTGQGVQHPGSLPALPTSAQPTASSSPQASGTKTSPPERPQAASTPPQLVNRTTAAAPPSSAAPQVSGTKAPPTKAPQVASALPQPASRAAAPTAQSAALPQLAANRAPIAENPGIAGMGGDGYEELAMAQSYLNGRHGAPRDSTEAVKWLWRSVAKQNSTATLLLSDFYLRGDGVSKSCDQARLLLGAAARKGTAGAGERIRNLQAFGCQ